MQSTNITCIYLMNHQKTFKRLYITYNSCCEIIVKRKFNNVNNPYIILRISSSFNYHDEQIKTIFWVKYSDFARHTIHISSLIVLTIR